MIRTGLIGYGLGGMAFHAPFIDSVPELALAAIATSRADEVHKRYPGVHVTGVEALIGDPGSRSSPSPRRTPRIIRWPARRWRQASMS